MRMHRTGRAELPGQRLPLAASPKHIDNGGKYLPGGHRLAPRTGFALILAALRPLALGNQRFQLAPQRVRHRPRLDLYHLEKYLHPDQGATPKEINRGNRNGYYLRICTYFRGEIHPQVPCSRVHGEYRDVTDSLVHFKTGTPYLPTTKIKSMRYRDDRYYNAVYCEKLS